MVDITSISGLSFQLFIALLFTLIATTILGGLAYVILTRFLKTRMKQVSAKRTAKFAMYLIYAGGLFYAVNNVAGLNLGASLAALGILGTLFLLPAIPLLQNIVAGIVLSVENNYREEDVIEYNGEVCIVKDIFLRKTRLRSVSGKIIHVPNSLFIALQPVVNFTQGQFIRSSIAIDIKHVDDIEKASAILKDICKDNIHILPNIPQAEKKQLKDYLRLPIKFLETKKNIDELQPHVVVTSLGNEKTNLKLAFWIWNIVAQEKINSELYIQIAFEFKRQGIALV